MSSSQKHRDKKCKWTTVFKVTLKGLLSKYKYDYRLTS